MQMRHNHFYQITIQTYRDGKNWLSDGAAYQIHSQLTIEWNISFIWLGIIYPVIPDGKQEDGVPQKKHTKISTRLYRTTFVPISLSISWQINSLRFRGKKKSLYRSLNRYVIETYSVLG